MRVTRGRNAKHPIRTVYAAMKIHPSHTSDGAILTLDVVTSKPRPQPMRRLTGRGPVKVPACSTAELHIVASGTPRSGSGRS